VSTLYVVSTPIGNLDDVSERAASVLRSVDRVLAEDTRRTRVLAEHVGSTAPLVSLHAHNERERLARMIGWLDAGEELAVVSDAGTPLVSDPGARTVQEVVAAGHRVVPVPGPSAVLAALVGSGLATERFLFLGFPARKGQERDADLDRVAGARESVVLFESPRRLVRLLDDLTTRCEEGRHVAVGRELTKLHEEFVRGTLPDVARYYRERPPKGEVTVVVAPPDPDLDLEGSANEAEVRSVALAQELLDDGMRPSSVAREVAERLGLARNEAYRIVHSLEGGKGDG